MQKNTIWIAGSHTPVGKAVKMMFAKHPGYRILETKNDLDISDAEAVKGFADMAYPNIIINCMSLPAPVGVQEDQLSDQEKRDLKKELYRVNALGAANLASVSRSHNAEIIHVSDASVYSGALPNEFVEYDHTYGKSLYAKSRVAGENQVKELNPKHMIIRVGTPYGSRKNPDDLYRQIVEQGRNNEPLHLTVTQWGQPTSVLTIASVIKEAIDHAEYGIYHVADKGNPTLKEFAREVLAANDLNPDLAANLSEEGNGIVLEDLVRQMRGKKELPDWKADLDAYVASRKEARA
ncbi:MAG: sugar nucleotide-binding protein [Ileibacterium sp.]|nr:sugar nucleotide-binding protein [Ileibacterium sp.]